MIEDLSDPELFLDWGLWYFLVKAVAVALTAFIPPLPSEAMVIASGAMASDRLMPLSLALGVTFLGCLLGDIGLYLTFRYRLVRILHRWKWGRTLHRTLLRASIRAGGATTWIGLLLLRGIPGGRAASMATAGMMGLSWPLLIPLALVGAATWTGWLVGLGYITGTTTGLPPLVATIMGILVGTLVGLLIAAVAARGRFRRV